MPFWKWISTTALSFTISGGTGVCPFMSLFLVGLVEKINPDLLQMDGTIEWILSSWISIAALAVLTGLEFVGKCIPIVDTILDTAMTFVVPICSILGSLSTFGLFSVINNNNYYNNEEYQGGGDSGGGRQRNLGAIGSAFVTCLQIVVVGCGIILALCMHGIKMLCRLIG